jgi:hypothetical protein
MLYMLLNLIFTIPLGCRQLYPHFTGKETESERLWNVWTERESDIKMAMVDMGQNQDSTPDLPDSEPILFSQ